MRTTVVGLAARVQRGVTDATVEAFAPTLLVFLGRVLEDGQRSGDPV